MGRQRDGVAMLVPLPQAAKKRAERLLRLADTRRVGVTMHAFVSPVEGRYEVSTYPGSSMVRSATCWAVSRSTTTIVPPQNGHSQMEVGSAGDGCERDSGSAARSCWH